jgi:hypothetical protein
VSRQAYSAIRFCTAVCAAAPPLQILLDSVLGRCRALFSSFCEMAAGAACDSWKAPCAMMTLILSESSTKPEHMSEGA